MITEIATIDVAPGQEEKFAAVYPGVAPLLSVSGGFQSLRLIRGVENPSRFVAIVEWDSIEAHRENFVQTERFQKFATLVMPFLAGEPTVEHFVDC